MPAFEEYRRSALMASQTPDIDGIIFNRSRTGLPCRLKKLAIFATVIFATVVSALSRRSSSQQVLFGERVWRSLRT